MQRTVEHEEAIARAADRFARATDRRSTFYYVSSKLRRDPFTGAIAALGPLGDVLDIGCGRGQLSVYLLEAGLARRVRAFDWDAEKVELAQRAAEGLDASFEVLGVEETIARASEPDADTVLLVDVLHYLDVATQDELIRFAADRVRPGGRLVVRDATLGCGWRSIVTVGVEQLSKLIRLNIGERISVRDVSSELLPLLEAKGMTCRIEPCWEGTPFSNVLLLASRPG